MALSIKSREAEAKARELAALTGVTITTAILQAVDEKLERERRRQSTAEGRYRKIMAIARRCAALPLLDTRTEDEILGYDENGIPA